MSNHEQTEDTDASLRELIEITDGPPDIRLDDVHGLDNELEHIQEVFIPTIAAPHAEVRSPSVLIHGPEGAGKTRIAQAIAGELSMHDYEYAHFSPNQNNQIQGNPHHPGSEETVAQLINLIRDAAPATLLIEDFEGINIRDSGAFHKAIRKIRDAAERVAILCVLSRNDRHFDRHHASEYFDFADFKIHVPYPDGDRRAHVLEEILERLTTDTEITVDADIGTPLSGTIDFEITHIHDVGRRAVALSQARSPPSPTVTINEVRDAIDQLNTELADVDTNQNDSVESLFNSTAPETTFDDIGGLDDVAQRLEELVTYPQQYEEFYAESKLEPTNGVLLHGPPGTGKTMLAKALANETDRTFYAVEGAEIKSMWFGQSEEHIRRLFAEARDATPSIIFFDEFDAVAGKRKGASHSTAQSIVNTLLAELDGIAANEDILSIAATNRPEAIDPAIKRSGRIGESIEVPPPDESGLQEIFRIQTRGLVTEENVTPSWFTRIIPEGLTGADIAAIVERATHCAIRQANNGTMTPKINRSHLQSAIEEQIEFEVSERRGFH